eukprot:COSAG02_NODE_2844_length_7905_cov_33.004356_4_plen_686_part_00
MRLLTADDKARHLAQLAQREEQSRAVAVAYMQQLLVSISENDSDVDTFSCTHSTEFGQTTVPVDDTLAGKLAAALRGNTHVLHLQLTNSFVDIPGHGNTLTDRGVSMLEAVISRCAVEFVDLPPTISLVRRTAVAALGLANICASIAADSPRYSTLDLSGVGLSDDTLGALAKALRGNTQVERVILCQTWGPTHSPPPTFTDAGLELLGQSIPECAVNNVALSINDLDGVSAAARTALQRIWIPKLVSWIACNDPRTDELDMCDCGLDDLALGQITRALQCNTHITYIDLSEGNDLITEEGLAVLAAGIPACRVRSVMVPGYNSDWVGQESCDANARASDIERVRENDPSLTIVDWSTSSMGCSDGTMAVLVEALRGNTHVRELRIGSSRDGIGGMTDAGAALLLDAIPHTVIERADVSADAVSVEFKGSRGWGSEKGIIAQACLKNIFARRIAANDPTLTALDLSKRGITTSTACALASALDGNTCLRTLDLSLNPRIGIAGLQALQATISRSAVQQVSLLCGDGSVPLQHSIANHDEGMMKLSDKLGQAAEAIESICARNEAVTESIAAHRPLQLLLLGAMISRGQDSKATRSALVTTHLPVTFGVVESKIREHLTACRVCPDVLPTGTGQLPLVRAAAKVFEWHVYQEGRRECDGKLAEERARDQPPPKRARVEQASDWSVD